MTYREYDRARLCQGRDASIGVLPDGRVNPMWPKAGTDPRQKRGAMVG